MRVMVDRKKLSEAEFLAAAPYSPVFRTRRVEPEETPEAPIAPPPPAVP